MFPVMLARILRGGAVVSLLTTPPGSASASPESPFFEELPLTTALSSLPQTPMEAPAAITVIDREMIRSLGPVSIAEILRLVPGFLVAAARSTRPQVAHHGLADSRNRRFLLLIDGRSAYTPYFLGGIEWNLLPVSAEDIDRIEVVRGSNSPMFGSNALLGVANIVTRSARAEDRGEASLVVGSDRSLKASAAYSVGNGQGDMRVRVEKTHTQGFEPEDHGHRTAIASTRVDYLLSPRDSIEFHAGSVRNREEIGLTTDLNQPPRSFRRTLDFVMARWHHGFGLDPQTTLTAYHRRETGNDVVPAGSEFVPGVIVRLDYGYRVERTDVEIHHRRASTPETRFMVSAAARLDNFNFPFGLEREDDGDITQFRLRAHAEHDLGKRLTAHLGALSESESGGSARFSPRFSLNFRPDLNNSLRVTILQAWRLPTPFERASDERVVVEGTRLGLAPGPVLAVHRSIPNRLLRPERLRTIEIGHVARLASDRLLLETRIQREEISDTIVAVAVANPDQLLPPVGAKTSQQFRNRSSLRIDSAEIVANWRPDPRNWLAAWATAFDAKSNDKPLARSVPRFIAGISASRTAGPWSLGALYSHSASVNWFGGASRAPGLSHLSVNARRHLAAVPGIGRTELALEARKTFGKRTPVNDENEHETVIMLRLSIGI